MSDRAKTVQRRNAATPFAEDVIGLLSEQMAGGGQSSFGLGVGPLQREAGTAMRQFVQTGAQLPQEMQDAIRDRQTVERERAMANLGERFSTSGLELGTPGQVGQARLLSELVPRQTEQFFQEQRAQGDQLMRAIMGMQTMGQQNIDPFIQLAGQGLFSPQVLQQEHPFVTAAGALGGLAKGAGAAAKGF